MGSTIPHTPKRPQVALESTLVAFGLPHPRNVEVAWKLARAVRSAGAEGKTLAVIDGTIHVGLHDDDLERVAHGKGVMKLAASDLGPAMALGLTGATTVSATCALAYGAGIQVFATGGIGGVHREHSETLDESQDLGALARYPVAVVCSGAKAILDLPKTMERLETLGVPVVGFQTSELPAFYSRSSGVPLVHRADDVQTLARIAHAHWRMHPGVGLVVANPIPEENEIPHEEIEEDIAKALEEARGEGIRGKALTPWLLKRLQELTEGRSVEANIALAESNARVAGELACAIHELEEQLA
jgi:pseudouridine-5'-phosphate glycosidase